MILGRYVLHVSHQTRLPFLIHINFISYDFDLSFFIYVKSYTSLHKILWQSKSSILPKWEYNIFDFYIGKYIVFKNDWYWIVNYFKKE